MKISKERMEEIKELFLPYKFVEVDMKYPRILVSLYWYRPTFNILVECLTKIKELPEASENFETDLDYGYYDTIDDVKIEVTLQK